VRRGSPPAEPPPRDAGAALVTVLVMLVVMAILATAVLEAARFSLRRLDNQRQMDQARWFLLGAERFAASRADDLADATERGDLDRTAWQGQPIAFPIDGGAISLTLWDGSNCFNLNSVVLLNEDDQLVANPAGMIEFTRVLEASQALVFNAPALAAALTDYLDTDSIPLPGGVEDEPSPRATGSAYRTANTLIGDVSELLGVRGFSPEVVADVAPLVCARDRTAASVLNVNGLQARDAGLLRALFGEELSLSAAQGLIAGRPRQGWDSVESFLRDPRLSGLEFSDAMRARFAVRPRFLIMTARVRWQGLEEASAALIEVGPPSRVVRRVMGAQASERSV
jgi:general secretion pathway protein K